MDSNKEIEELEMQRIRNDDSDEQEEVHDIQQHDQEVEDHEQNSDSVMVSEGDDELSSLV